MTTTESLGFDDPSGLASPTEDFGIPIEFIKQEVESVEVGDVAIATSDSRAKTDDDRTLYRFIRRRAQIASERQRIADQMGAMLRDLDNQLKGIDYVYEGLCADITRTLLDGKKAKSIKTPFGTVGFRTIAGKLSVTDPEKVLALVDAGKLPAEVKRVKTEVAMQPLSHHYEQTGDLPEGCEVSAGYEKFYVK